MPQPIIRKQIVADNIHGETGLDGPVFEPLTRQAESTHAVKYIIDTLMANDGDITLCRLVRFQISRWQCVCNPRSCPKSVKLC